MLDAVLARLGSLHPKVIDLSLDRVRDLLDRLGNPQDQLPPVVHIAGTNGKGSTLAGLRAIAEAAGLSVHAYTSPHLVRFNERIRVAGRLIADGELEELLLHCEAVNDGRPVTFFEITTAAAFLAFARSPADLCLLETGMGGRLDATNVITQPALTLIASLSMDHEAYLGPTLAAIAGEKAGILKPGVPCFAQRQKAEAEAVLKARAEVVGAPLRIEGSDWTANETMSGGLDFTMDGQNLALPRPSLKGPHQIANGGLAVAAARMLGATYPTLAGMARPETLARGLAAIDWPARLQRLTRGPLTEGMPSGWELWLDGGHNPGAGEILGQVAADWGDRPLDLVVGMLTTKDTATFLKPLLPHARRLIAIGIPGDANSRPAAETAEIAVGLGFEAESAASAELALARLLTSPGPARVLICGSLYLAGTILEKNG